VAIRIGLPIPAAMRSKFAAKSPSLSAEARSIIRIGALGAPVNRLQKFVEKGAAGPPRVAYAFGVERLPPAERGRVWEQVAGFNPAEELLENGSLKAVFHAAIAQGCAVIPTDVKQ
jgi:hypothetical protein